MTEPLVVEGVVRDFPEGRIIITDEKKNNGWGPDELFEEVIGKRVRVTVETDLPVLVTMDIPKCSYCGEQLTVGNLTFVCPTVECQHNKDVEDHWKQIRICQSLKCLKEELNGQEVDSLERVASCFGVHLFELDKQAEESPPQLGS